MGSGWGTDKTCRAAWQQLLKPGNGVLLDFSPYFYIWLSFSIVKSEKKKSPFSNDHRIKGNPLAAPAPLSRLVPWGGSGVRDHRAGGYRPPALFCDWGSLAVLALCRSCSRLASVGLVRTRMGAAGWLAFLEDEKEVISLLTLLASVGCSAV